MRRKHRSARERERLFLLHEGRCHVCGQKIKAGEAWELEHIVPWELTHDESDENVKPAHKKNCHASKTKKDVAGIRKADRQRQKHLDMKKSQSPMPGSRASKWKRKMDGTVVPRD